MTLHRSIRATDEPDLQLSPVYQRPGESSSVPRLRLSRRTDGPGHGVSDGAGISGCLASPLLRLGRDGYRRVQQTCRDVAVYLSTAIEGLGPFRLLTDGSQLPVFAFALREPLTYSADLLLDDLKHELHPLDRRRTPLPPNGDADRFHQ